MSDLLSRYGPNMAELERAINRRVAASGVGHRPKSAPAAQAPFSAALKGEGLKGSKLPDQAPLSDRYSPEDIAKARATAEEFESFFISQMLQPMFENLSTDPPFGGGNSERIWRSLMLDQYGEMVAKKGGVGVADAVMREMLKNQEV